MSNIKQTSANDELILQNSSLLAYIIYGFIGFLLSCSLFLLLAHITASPTVINTISTTIPHFDLFINETKDDLKTLSRVFPPPPDDVKLAVTPPKMQQNKRSESNELKVKIDLSLASSNDMPLATMGDLLGLADVELNIDSNPEITSHYPPQYPWQALRAKIEGFVTIDFVIDTTGRANPNSLTIVESSPADIFDDNVKRAIERWRFKVRSANGKAISYRARQTLTFKLDH